MEQTAHVFLIDLQTLLHWMRRVDEQGEPGLVQTVEPANRYPDFVRNLVRQLKRLFPMIGNERMAQILARAGLALSATTIRRMIRERSEPDPEPELTATRRRRVVARYPGHTWHVDLTTVPTRAGFWVPWFPFSIPQRWPFCWWIAVAVDQMSRGLVGFAVFPGKPTSAQIRQFLGRAIRRQRSELKYIVSDKDSVFRCKRYRSWCKQRGIRPRYGALGEPASIPIVERFIRSMKQECTRCVLVPMSHAAMRRELSFYTIWYNTVRPHATHAGHTPHEVHAGRFAHRKRLEPRPKWPRGIRRRGGRGDRFDLEVGYVDGKKHLPVIELRRAA